MCPKSCCRHPAISSHPTDREGGAYAEKSADAVTAKAASLDNLACQTAPLCPIKVPILECLLLAPWLEGGCGVLTNHR